MVKMTDFVKVFRVNQWYKNVLVFLPLIFSLNMFNFKLFILTFLGFIALCLLSSSYYIINDIKDSEKDKQHPEKKNRPIASGRIGKKLALIISIALFYMSMIIGYLLSIYFLLFMIILFSLSIFYTFIGREMIFLDIIIIALNFVIRAYSGIFLINVPGSYWMDLTIFFIAIHLVSMKRIAESKEKNIHKYRKSLSNGGEKIYEMIAIMSFSCTYIFFCIYSIFKKPAILLSLPAALYISFSFFNELGIDTKKVRNPEKFIFQKRIIISLIIWFLILAVTFYLF